MVRRCVRRLLPRGVPRRPPRCVTRRLPRRLPPPYGVRRLAFALLYALFGLRHSLSSVRPNRPDRPAIVVLR